MRYVVTAETDIGNVKDTNQDSILIKHATYEKYEVLMAIICDGMGGLSKGELASAIVIKRFNEWFIKELPLELKNIDMDVIGGKWSLLLKTLNVKIREYGETIGKRLGTTFTGVLIVNQQFIAVHVGDTRLYYIGTSLQQITDDQTFVAREISKGAMTAEQAKIDSRRNMLLQCIGASKSVSPQIIKGNINQGIYMLCSDGFRHKITEKEMLEQLNIKELKNKRDMMSKSKFLVKLVKQRDERDNISVVLIKSISNEYKANKLTYIKDNLFSKKPYWCSAIVLILSVLAFLFGLLSM